MQSPTRGSCRPQRIRSVMDKPRPGKATTVITLSPGQVSSNVCLSTGALTHRERQFQFRAGPHGCSEPGNYFSYQKRMCLCVPTCPPAEVNETRLRKRWVPASGWQIVTMGRVCDRNLKSCMRGPSSTPYHCLSGNSANPSSFQDDGPVFASAAWWRVNCG